VSQRSRHRILIVEDDGNLAAVVRENLTFEGFDVQVAATGELALEHVGIFLPHLIVLDIMLPGMSGFDVCELLRREGRIPILLVSARGQQNDKVRGLNLGADDYLVKPFALEELTARINAILRRSQAAADELVLGRVRVDFRSHVAYRGDDQLHLTHREFELLKYLSDRAGRVVGRAELLRDLWEFPDPGITRSVDHAIGRLRRKIELDPHHPRFLHTAVNDGYLLTPEGR